MNKTGIVLYCSAGYILEEAYLPLIKELSKEFKIFLLVENNFLNKRHIFKIEEFKKQSFIYKYFFVPGQDVFPFQHQKKIKEYCIYFSKLKINSFLLPNDFSISSRYIIRYSKNKKYHYYQFQ